LENLPTQAAGASARNVEEGGHQLYPLTVNRLQVTVFAVATLDVPVPRSEIERL
jgi:hypothetical protein